MSYGKSLFKVPRMMPEAPHLSGLLLSLFVALALLALACAPAQPPTAAPGEAGPAVAPPTATVLPVVLGASGAIVVPTTGRYVERAGVRLFIPDGYEFGGPTIPPDPRPPRYGGTMIEAQPGDAPSLDPYQTTGTYAQAPTALLYERLLHVPTEPGTDLYRNVRVPGLAESWDISSDFLTYTFHLRKGVKWHNLPPVNGREMDAEDVKFTWDLFMSKGSVEAGFFTNVDRGEVIDKYTVVLHMKAVDPAMLSLLGDIMRGYVLPRESATFSRLGTAIGTGPFMVQQGKDYEYKVGITFQRNPDYWLSDARGNRLPYLDRFQYIIMADATARLVAFRTGKIDRGASVATPTELRSLMKTNPTTLVQETRPNHSAPGVAVGMRLDKAPWNDVRVRRAMSLALDYQTVSQTVFEVPATTSQRISAAWYGGSNALNATIEVCGCPWYSYDPKRAKALLAEAGFPNGFDTTFVYYAYAAYFTAEWELYQAYWKAIGVNVKLISQDYTVFRGNIDTGGWENLSHSFNFPSPSTFYANVQPLLPGHAQNPANGFVNDPKLTALAKEVLASYKDEAKAIDLVRQTHAYYLDQVYTFPSLSANGYGFFSPRLRNYQPGNNSIVTDHRQKMHAWIDNDWAFNK